METTNYSGVFIAFVFLYAIPLGFVLTDPVIGKKERIIWIVATIWGSWATCIVYFLIAPILPGPYDTREEPERREPGIGDRY